MKKNDYRIIPIIMGLKLIYIVEGEGFSPLFNIYNSYAEANNAINDYVK